MHPLSLMQVEGFRDIRQAIVQAPIMVNSYSLEKI